MKVAKVLIRSWVFMVISCPCFSAEASLDKVMEVLQTLKASSVCSIESELTIANQRFAQLNSVRKLTINVRCGHESLSSIFYEPTVRTRFSVGADQTLREALMLTQGSNGKNALWDAERYDLRIVHDGEGGLLEVDFQQRILRPVKGIGLSQERYKVARSVYWVAE